MAFQLSADGSVAALSVFAHLDGEPVPMGELRTIGRRGLSSEFRYDPGYIDGPAVPPSPVAAVNRRGIASDALPIPLFLYDSIPDGWGRHVLGVAFPGHDFTMLDYLAAAGRNRTGFLSVGASADEGPDQWFPETDRAFGVDATPATPEELLGAAEDVQNGRARPRHLNMLLRGSPALGGARPKSTFVTADGQHVILKFPIADDALDEQKAEAVCLRLATEAGIDTPAFQTHDIDGRTVLQVDRFDREADGRRLAYASACVVVGADPSRYSAPQANYADICQWARRLGIEDPSAEMFRRMIFNAFVHNTDDHLFNHGFIRDAATGRWRLSPVFDIVPQKKKLHVVAATRDGDRGSDPVRKFAVHEAFGIARVRAEEIYADVVDAMARMPEALEEFEVGKDDRERLMEMMPQACDPPRLDA